MMKLSDRLPKNWLEDIFSAQYQGLYSVETLQFYGIWANVAS